MRMLDGLADTVGRVRHRVPDSISPVAPGSGGKGSLCLTLFCHVNATGWMEDEDDGLLGCNFLGI